MSRKSILSILLVLNVLVLLGQLWPEGAPPFARVVNIITLFCNIAFFGAFIRMNKRADS